MPYVPRPKVSAWGESPSTAPAAAAHARSPRHNAPAGPPVAFNPFLQYAQPDHYQHILRRSHKHEGETRRVSPIMKTGATDERAEDEGEEAEGFAF